jgi:hypothetical protein
LYRPFLALLAVYQQIQISEIDLKALPELGITQVPSPNKLSHSPDCTTEVTGCLRQCKQPGIGECAAFYYRILRLHEFPQISVGLCGILRATSGIFN